MSSSYISINRIPGALMLCACITWCSNGISAEEQLPAERGLAIALEADRRDSGFGDSRAELQMILTTGEGESVSREMRQMTIEVEDDGDRTIMVFDRPRDLAGTAVLTHTHKTGNDDQWLYLPALKRVKRISAADRSGPFMGSEFAFEDLASYEVEKYRYRYLGDEPCGDLQCYVLERVPVDTKSGYTRQVAWIDQDHYRLQKIDYYDRKSELLKTMVLTGYQRYLERYWRPDQMTMHNHQNSNSTILSFDSYQLDTGMSQTEFTRGALSRVR